MPIAGAKSGEIQLFEPPRDAIYTIETTSSLVSVSRHTILVYCKHHLLSPATNTTDHGYYFDGDAIHTLRRIEALRTVCGKDFAGIKIILDLTAALERFGHTITVTDERIRFGEKESENGRFRQTPVPLIPIQVTIQTGRAIS